MPPPAHAPVLLGVVGDSAAGKTTITTGIARILGADSVTVICSDDYHRYNRRQRAALDLTALHPDCNYVDILEQHLRCIAAGEPILKPVYNHATGDFEPPEYVTPKRFVIVEGLLGFHTAALRDAFQVKVFLDPTERLRREWKLGRDCARRGYAPDAVLAELERREPDSANFIRPQKRWADLVVRFHPPARPHAVEQLDAEITLRSTLRHPNMAAIAARVGERAGEGDHSLRVTDVREGARTAQVVHVDGRLTADRAALVEGALWTEHPDLQQLLPEQIGQFVDGDEQRRSHPLALVQMLIAYHLLLGRIERERTITHSPRAASFLQ
jgi:phosphoribulokinase